MHLLNNSCRTNVSGGIGNGLPEQQNFLYCSENVLQKIYCRNNSARAVLARRSKSDLQVGRLYTAPQNWACRFSLIIIRAQSGGDAWERLVAETLWHRRWPFNGSICASAVARSIAFETQCLPPQEYCAWLPKSSQSLSPCDHICMIKISNVYQSSSSMCKVLAFLCKVSVLPYKVLVIWQYLVRPHFANSWILTT